MTGSARATVQIDDGRVRVTRFDMAPGDRIPSHRHEHDYVVVPLTDGEVEVLAAGATTVQCVRAGEAYARAAGAEHELVNGPHPYSFIEVESIPPRST